MVVRLYGGLGNQMFQYAAALAASIETQATLLLDTSWFSSIKSTTHRDYLLNQFPNLVGEYISRERLTREYFVAQTTGSGIAQAVKGRLGRALDYTKWTNVVTEPHEDYLQRFASGRKRLFLEGYRQNESYFLKHADAIRHAFAFPDSLPSAKESIRGDILSADASVSLHVRRGDYVSGKRSLGTCTHSYYEEAIARISSEKDDVHVFVFSDEPQWAQENLHLQVPNITVVPSISGESPLHDLHLMSLCKHQILANSSFSWWGAWLSGERGLVVAPDPWFAGASVGSPSPCPSRWSRVQGLIQLGEQ